MKKIVFAILLLIPILWLSSCNEETSEIDYNPNVLSAKDYISAEDAILEIVNAFLKGINDTLVLNSNYGFIDYCDVQYFPSENALRFSYGEVNRMCPDNKFRRGLYWANFSGPLFDEGISANIFTDSLFVDNLLVEANMDIKNLGLNSNNLPEYSLTVNSSMIMLPDTAKINGVSITTSYNMVWSQGSATPAIHEDDIYLISGTASGISSNGTDFSVAITESLTNYLDCFWISQGSSQITVPIAEFPTGDIDYIMEDGCNNEIHFYFNDNLFYHFIK